MSGFIPFCNSRIPDPEAEKPEDWDEDAPQKIADPNAVKPDGWLDDGPEYIPDPDATVPDDWYSVGRDTFAQCVPRRVWGKESITNYLVGSFTN